MSPKAMYFRDLPWAQDLSLPLFTQAWGPSLLGPCLPTSLSPAPCTITDQCQGLWGGTLSLCLPLLPPSMTTRGSRYQKVGPTPQCPKNPREDVRALSPETLRAFEIMHEPFICSQASTL